MCELSPKISTVIHDPSDSRMNVNNPHAQIQGHVNNQSPLLLSSSSSSSSSSSLFSRCCDSRVNDSDAASSPKGSLRPRDFSEKFRACLPFIRYAHSRTHTSASLFYYLDKATQAYVVSTHPTCFHFTTFPTSKRFVKCVLKRFTK